MFAAKQILSEVNNETIKTIHLIVTGSFYASPCEPHAQNCLKRNCCNKLFGLIDNSVSTRREKPWKNLERPRYYYYYYYSERDVLLNVEIFRIKKWITNFRDSFFFNMKIFRSIFYSFPFLKDMFLLSFNPSHVF